jgi:type IV pilus assembly protein PilY1
VTPGPLFTTPAGQPITTQLVIAGGSAMPGLQPQVMVLFGTGQKTAITNTSPATYAANGQSLYGVWDWNMAGWNAVSGAQYSSLAGSATGLSGGNHTIAKANLQGQTVNVGSSGDVEILNNSAVCWQGLTLCGSNNNKFGWYINLPGTQEQIVFNPELIAQAFTVNSIVPAANSPVACTTSADTGFTYVVSAMTGGAFNQVFFPPGQAGNSTISNNPAFTDAHAIAMQTNATGSSFVVYNNSGVPYLVFQTTTPGSGGAGGGGGGNNGNGTNYPGLNLPPNTSGKRLSWIERR